MESAPSASSGTAVPVSVDTEAVLPEFECSICMKLLFEPVTVPCGHTFCRICLQQSLGYRGLCAVCRAPVSGGQAVNVLIRSIIEEKYPLALQRRREEQEQELEDGERDADDQRRAEVAGSGAANVEGMPVLPILRCQLPSPHCPTEMEFSTVAETRLLEYALQGARRVGALQQGGSLGVCLEIDHVERDSRHTRVRFASKFRFRLGEQSQWHEEGFELGRCEAFFDTALPVVELSAPAEAGAQTALEVGRAALELVERQISSLGHGGRQAFSEHFGDVPALRGTSTTSANLEVLSFWLLGVLVSDAVHRARWLGSTDTRGRLEDALSRLQAGTGRPMLDLPGARSWMNAGQSATNSLLLLLAVVALLIAKALGLFDRHSRGHASYESWD